MSEREIAERYRKRADAFESKIRGVRDDQWSNPSPCDEWDARAVVGHVIDMHSVMLRPFDRGLSPAASLEEDPLAAFRAARADIEAVLEDAELSAKEVETHTGKTTVAEHIDGATSQDMVLHTWDLARATGQDDTLDPEEVERYWNVVTALPAELQEKMRTPGAFGPGIVVFGPEVKVPDDAPLQDRLLGMIGRDPR